LDEAFELRWPELESKVRKILQTTPPAAEPERDERSLLEEVVGVVRSLHNEQRELHDAVNYIAKAVSPTPNELMVNALRGGTGALITPFDPAQLAVSLMGEGGTIGGANLSGTSFVRGGSATGLTVDPGVEKRPKGPTGPASSERKAKK
jgi:hypothetical protein